MTKQANNAAGWNLTPDTRMEDAIPGYNARVSAAVSNTLTGRTYPGGGPVASRRERQREWARDTAIAGYYAGLDRRQVIALIAFVVYQSVKHHKDGGELYIHNILSGNIPHPPVFAQPELFDTVETPQVETPASIPAPRPLHVGPAPIRRPAPAVRQTGRWVSRHAYYAAAFCIAFARIL